MAIARCPRSSRARATASAWQRYDVRSRGALRGFHAAPLRRGEARGFRCSAAATTGAPTASSRPRAARSAAARSRSRARGAQVVADGITEIVLLGPDGELVPRRQHDFADLLRAVGAVPGMRRLRFTSPHPNDFSGSRHRGDGRGPARCASTCTCPCSPDRRRTLKRMLRRYTREGYLECAERCAPRFPGSRSRRTSSSASPAKPRRSSRRRSTWCARSASTTRTLSSSPRATERRPRVCPSPGPSPTRWRASDSRGSSRRCAPARAR